MSNRNCCRASVLQLMNQASLLKKMQSKNTMTHQTDIHQNDVDLRCTEATRSRKYSILTHLIDDELLDPNELVDARKRIYGSRNYKVSAYLDETNNTLHWSICAMDSNYAEKSTILHQAIARKNAPLVDAILASNKTNPNQKSERGYTPLHYAAIVGDPTIVKRLIERGADSTVTCNGFKPADFVYEDNISVKKLLYSVSEPNLLSSLFPVIALLPDFLAKYLLKTPQYSEQSLSYPESSAQFGIRSKMRAMCADNEIIYASGRGVCCGGAYIAMFFILSNERDEQGNIIGQTQLEYILKQLIVLSTEDFLEKIALHETKRLDLYKNVCTHVDAMTAQEIAIGLENEVRSDNIGSQSLNQAKLPSEKKRVLIQKKFESVISLNFSFQERIELGFRAFTDGVEILQSIQTHPELQQPSQAIRSQIPSTVFPLLMTPELEELGGLSKPITCSGVFLNNNAQDKNEIELYFECLCEKFNLLTFPVALQLSANLHAISVFYDPIKKNWMLIDINRSDLAQLILTTSENTEISSYVYNALKFGHEGKPGLEPVKPYLIMSIEIYTAKQYEAQLEQQIALLDDNEEFQAIFDITPLKAVAVDNGNHTWLDWAIQYAQINTVCMLHQKHVFEYRDPTLDRYKAEYMAKILEQCERYYQRFDDNHYAYRDDLIVLAYQLRKETTTEGIPHIENNRLQYKFLLEVLKNTPIGQAATEDDANIMQSIMSCYAQWHYQGRDVSVLFSDAQLADLIQRATSNHTDFVLNINKIVEQDNDLLIHIREVIHELEKTSSDDAAIAFLSDCLITAGKQAATNALNNLSGGVLNQTIQDARTQCQYRGSVSGEENFSTSHTVTFFKTLDESAEKDSTLNKGSKPTEPHSLKK